MDAGRIRSLRPESRLAAQYTAPPPSEPFDLRGCRPHLGRHLLPRSQRPRPLIRRVGHHRGK